MFVIVPMVRIVQVTKTFLARPRQKLAGALKYQSRLRSARAIDERRLIGDNQRIWNIHRCYPGTTDGKIKRVDISAVMHIYGYLAGDMRIYALKYIAHHRPRTIESTIFSKSHQNIMEACFY